MILNNVIFYKWPPANVDYQEHLQLLWRDYLLAHFFSCLALIKSLVKNNWSNTGFNGSLWSGAALDNRVQRNTSWGLPLQYSGIWSLSNCLIDVDFILTIYLNTKDHQKSNYLHSGGYRWVHCSTQSLGIIGIRRIVFHLLEYWGSSRNNYNGVGKTLNRTLGEYTNRGGSRL